MATSETGSLQIVEISETVDELSPNQGTIC